MRLFGKTTVFAFLIALIMAPSVGAQKLKPEEIIAKHLESIGSPEARSALKSFVAVGDATVTYVTSKNHPAVGRVVIASAGEKLFFGMNLNANDYPHEKISFDGKDSKVSFVVPGQRSVLGNFILSNNVVLKHGLFTGTLSTSWPLRDLTTMNAKLSSNGVKKIGDVEAYSVSYTPKSGSDLDITLYFDKTSFRHIRTECKHISSASLGRTIDESARQNESRIRLVEDFGDFKDVKGLIVPHSYKMLYTITGAHGTREVAWTYTLTEFALNQKLDEGTFDAKW